MTQQITERFTITGDVGSPAFPPWIGRHAGRLGLSAAMGEHSDRRVSLMLRGPADLIDAMELACSLGPYEVWVETIDRERLGDAPFHSA